MGGVWGIGFRRNGITSVREKAEGQETEWGTAEARNGWDGRTRFVVMGLRGGRAQRLDLKHWRWVGLGWTAVLLLLFARMPSTSPSRVLLLKVWLMRRPASKLPSPLLIKRKV